MEISRIVESNNHLIQKEFSSRSDFLSTITDNKDKVLLFKFTASWCNPCQKIKKEVNELINNLNQHIICYELDVDDNFDVYAFLKLSPLHPLNLHSLNQISYLSHLPK